MLQAVPKWRDRARSDHLTDLITTIPEKGRTSCAGRIAGRHLAKKSWSWPTSGAGETIAAAAEGRIEANRDLTASTSPRWPKFWASIRPSKTICWLPCSPKRRQPAAIGPLPHLATEDRAGETLLEGMSERAGRLWKAGRHLPGDAMLAAARRDSPRAPRGFAQQRVAWLRTRLADKDYTSVAKGCKR